MMLACPACSSRFRVNPKAIGDGREVRCSQCANQWFAMPGDLLDEKAAAVAAAPARAEAPKPGPARVAPPEPESETAAVAAPSVEASLVGDESFDFNRREEVAAPAPAMEREVDLEALDAVVAQNARRPEVRPQAIVRGPRKRALATAILALLFLNIGTAFLLFRDPAVRAMPFTEAFYALIGYENSAGLQLSDLNVTRFGSQDKPRFDVSGQVMNTTERPLSQPRVMVSMVKGEDEVLRSWEMGGGDRKIPPGQALTFKNQGERLTSSRAGEADALVIRLGSPMELLLSK